LPTTSQAETTQEAGHKVSDAASEQGSLVAAKMITGSGKLNDQKVSDLLRETALQTSPNSKKPLPNKITGQQTAGDLSGSAGEGTDNKPFSSAGYPQPSHGQQSRAKSQAVLKKDRSAGADDIPKARKRSNSPKQKRGRRPAAVSADSKNANRPFSEPILRAMPAGKNQPFVKKDFEALLAKTDIKSNRRNALAELMRLWNLKLSKEKDFEGLKNDMRFFQQAAEANDLSIKPMVCDLESLDRMNQPCILELFIPSLQQYRYVTLKALQSRRAVISAGGKTVDILITDDQLTPYWTGSAYIPNKKVKES
jgi:hypothetical protein